MRPNSNHMTPDRRLVRWCRRIDWRCAIGLVAVVLVFATIPANRLSARDTNNARRESRKQVPPPAPVWKAIFARPVNVPSPRSNPLTPDKVALGAQLFSDSRLSGGGTRACASCHQPDKALTDGRGRALCLSGRPLARNTPALWNLAWATRLHWDGSFPSLEAQARAPIRHPDELNSDLVAISARLNRDAEMRQRFADAFPMAPRATPINLVRALASYTRTRISPVTRFDRWIGGDQTALTPDEHAGFRLFAGKAGCIACHGGWRMTNDQLHDIGLPTAVRAFKTPGLRRVGRTSPYMHDGSLPTLTSVVRHYAEGIVDRPSLAPQLRNRARLSNKERARLVAFLKTL